MKKAGSNINKIKKSSIKRKVQNFSHESDDGIIEPLLQTDKEKSDIANRSAKFLLQKSKTDSSYEKDSKNVEDFVNKCSVSTPVQQANKLITNNIKENPPSTPYICGVAPIHNYMNTNIFSTYDMTKSITTKSPILVEIDGSKSGVYSPSPLIFTTAKIHTDSKTKLMEPLHVTPVPILSTIEGSVLRAGGLTNTDKKTTSVPQLQDSKINVCGKIEKNDYGSVKDKQVISTASNYISPNIEIISKNNAEYQTKATNDSILVKSLSDYSEKNQADGQLNGNKSAVGLDNNFGESSEKHEVFIPTNKSHIEPSSKPEGTIKTTLTKTVSDKTSPLDKTKDSEISGSFKSEKPQHLKSDTKSSISVPFEIKVTNMSSEKISAFKSSDIKKQEVCAGSTVEKSLTSGKKLQRQKNASIQDIQDLTGVGELSKINKTTAVEKQIKCPIEKVESVMSIKDNQKIEQISQEIITNVSKLDNGPSTVIVTPHTIMKSHVSTSTFSKPTASSSIMSTPKVIPLTTTVTTTCMNMANSKFIHTSSSKAIPKSTSKSSIVSPVSTTKNTTKLPLLIPVNITSTASSMIKSTPEKSCSDKSDIAVSQSSILYEQSSKEEKSLKCSSPIVSTLPSYIVSTSKTKIGSTFTTNTNTSTTKSQISTSLTETAFTTSSSVKSPGTQPCARPTVGISPTSATKHPNFSKQTQSDTVKKDGRA